jgi:hypothetical protein
MPDLWSCYCRSVWPCTRGGRPVGRVDGAVNVRCTAIVRWATRHAAWHATRHAASRVWGPASWVWRSTWVRSGRSARLPAARDGRSSGLPSTWDGWSTWIPTAWHGQRWPSRSPASWLPVTSRIRYTFRHLSRGVLRRVSDGLYQSWEAEHSTECRGGTCSASSPCCRREHFHPCSCCRC